MVAIQQSNNSGWVVDGTGKVLSLLNDVINAWHSRGDDVVYLHYSNGDVAVHMRDVTDHYYLNGRPVYMD